MKVLTRAQREALRKVYRRLEGSRQPQDLPTYLEFRRTVQYAFYDDCIMLPFAGMWLGIEVDGYTHS